MDDQKYFFIHIFRFFCDCGAGSGGVLCKLVSGDRWSVASRPQAAQVASGGQIETSLWRNIPFKIQSYGVTYRSKFSLGIFPIEKLIFVSEIN